MSCIISLLLIAGSLPLSRSAYFLYEDATFTRVINDPIRSVFIENKTGAINVRTWSSANISVKASRVENIGGASIESEVRFEQPDRETLNIVANPESLFRPITLTVHLPSSVQLSVKGGSERVTIKGSTSSLTVETDSGNVALYLPEKTNTDLSLRTIRGMVESRLPLTMFGQNDSRRLDGKIGKGGAPLIARSQRGNISLRSDSDTQLVGQTLEGEESEVTGGEKSLTGVTTKLNSNAIASAREISSENTIKLEARLVNLNVKVTDANGKTLPSLKKENFVVLEDGVQQDVSYFEPVTAPLNLLLLLDLSGSTEHKIKVMKKAAQKFIDSLQAGDRIAVAAFTRRFFIISNFTTDHKLLRDRIGDIKNRHSGTAYYDAMWAALDLLEESNATRKSIVVLTDGVDNSLSNPDESEFDPKHGFNELLARTEEAEATIYPIYLDTEYETIGAGGRRGHDAYVTARKQLQALADQTGAIMFKAEKAEDLDGVYQQVAAELHSLYSMAYTPKTVMKDGKWRKISITVEHPGAKARTKRGYFAR
jgi:Ca-activated chloride channel family protein